MKCLAGCRGLKPEALEVFFRCIAKKLRLGIENPSKGYIQRSRITSVCFRMYTEDEARKMGVVGWVKNTRQGTVTGQVQGPEDKVNAIKDCCLLGFINSCNVQEQKLDCLKEALLKGM
ncbi:acylphosphatase-2 isoform X8 [Chrysemys picta bellii]|uniref:acylphosphatase-2 isoform X8 n=1 Tax=Chrysemys picta bellii TaxID=8478 RepID=UPI001C67E685|nr:acylphosphatase-2 isoform X8 [Chrysemys picta bellii]